MSDEASQILAMVADGKITAEEGAQLLKALNRQAGDSPRQIHIKKIIHGDHGHGHFGRHWGGRMGGCHCVVMSGDDEVEVWKEHRDHA